jgi:hypothetical protein
MNNDTLEYVMHKKRQSTREERRRARIKYIRGIRHASRCACIRDRGVPELMGNA